ncbi:MAG: glycosyltransferase [Cyanobacteria bacterium J149]|nr:MAG: glycosyltransferase [Cyanobacteria bacterium J149]
MKITLITTTCDRPHHLWECALSVANQLTSPHQWIIYVDDELEKYQLILPKIKLIVPQAEIITNGKIGRVNALAYAHQFVKGDWVGWLDDDDWLDHRCLTMFQKYRDYASFIYTDFYEVRNGRAKIGERNTEPYSYKRLLENNIVFHFRLFETALYESVGGVDLTFDTTMDYELSLRLLKKATPLKINQPLYYYRIHRDRISAKLQHRQKENFKRAVEKNK